MEHEYEHASSGDSSPRVTDDGFTYDPHANSSYDVDEENTSHIVYRTTPHNRVFRLVLTVGAILAASTLLVLISVKVPKFEENILSKSEGPPAPSDLALLCDPNVIFSASSVGRAVCEEACEPAKCCLDEECYSKNKVDPEVCVDYAGCFTLLMPTEGSLTRVPWAPPSLARDCSFQSLSDPTNFDCDMQCEVAICCFEHDQIANCVTNNMAACESYAPCLLLDTVQDYSNSEMMEEGDGPSYVDQIQDLCTSDDINDMDNCEELCEMRRCCFAVGTSNCFDAENEAWCSEFAICADHFSVSAEKRGYVPPYPKIDLDSVCNYESADWDERGCEKGCEPGLCCIGGGSEGDCNEFEECSFYFACEQIWSTVGQIDRSASSDSADKWISQSQDYFDDYLGELESLDSADNNEVLDLYDPTIMCSAQKLKSEEGKNTCLTICEQFHCCWSQTNNCGAEREECKDSFHACPQSIGYTGTLITIPVKNDNSGTTDPVKNSGSTVSSTTNKGKPSGSTVSSTTNKGKPSGSNVSSNTNKGKPSESIAELVPYDDDFSSKMNLDPKCWPENLVTDHGRTACIEVCNDWKCCWKDGFQSCMADRDYCDDYFYACPQSPGFVLKDDDGILNDDNTQDLFWNVPSPEGFCTQDLGDPIAADDCRNACEPFVCCWIEGQDNCSRTQLQCYPALLFCPASMTLPMYHTDNRESASYDEISQQKGLPEEEDYETPEMTLVQEYIDPKIACSQDLEKYENKAECVAACRPRQCCWKGECDENSAQCEVVLLSCPVIVIKYINKLPSIPMDGEKSYDDVFTPEYLCLEENMKSPLLRSACNDECLDWECCWKEKGQGCSDNPECKDYIKYCPNPEDIRGSSNYLN